jgi:hypothetical protein
VLPVSCARAFFLAVVLWAVLPAGRTAAQVVPVDPEPDTLAVLASEPLQPGDSAALVRAARAAQARFERRRVRFFPMAWSRSSGGSCDEIIGRMCINFGRGSDWEPEPEAEEVLEGRAELLETLDQVAAEIPGDDWVLGQRIHYLGEAGLWDEAETLARECGGATRWWCEALRGHALHHLDRFQEAEAAFDRALEGMEPETAREWRDMERILDRDGYRRYRAFDEGAREALEQRVWAIADPLFLVPGNDLRTAHLSRRVASTIRERARNPHNIGWGSDMTEITVRYGPIHGWEQERGSWNHVGPPRVLGRFHPKSRGLLPPGRYLEDPATLPPGEWRTDQRRSRARYAPSYAPRIHALEPEVLRFRRGDSVLVLAAWEVEGSVDHPGADWIPAPEEGYRSGLFLLPLGSQGEGSRELLRSEAESGAIGRLRLRAPPGEYLLSVESWHPTETRAWRSREGLRHEPLVRGVIALSDLALLEPVTGPGSSRGKEEPSSLDDILPRILPRGEVPPGGIVEVAWEVYGLETQETALRFRVTVGREEPGLLRRAGQWLRLVEPEAPVVVAWSEAAPIIWGPWLRTVTLDLSTLEPGDYRLRLELEPLGRTAVRTERGIRVTGHGG